MRRSPLCLYSTHRRAVAPSSSVVTPPPTLGDALPRRPRATAPCSHECRPAWSADWRVPGVPGRLAGRHPRRAGGWRSCGAGRGDGWEPGTGGRAAAGRPGCPGVAPRRLRKTACGGDTRSRSGPAPSPSTVRRPRAQRSCMGTRRWRPPLPQTVTVRAREVEVADVEAAQLGHPQPAAVEELEHGVVADGQAWCTSPPRSTVGVDSSAPAGAGSGPALGAVEHVLELAAVEHPGQARRRRPATPGAGPDRRRGPHAGAARRSSTAARRPCAPPWPGRSDAWSGTPDSDGAGSGRRRPGHCTRARSAHVDEGLEVTHVGAHVSPGTVRPGTGRTPRRPRPWRQRYPWRRRRRRYCPGPGAGRNRRRDTPVAKRPAPDRGGRDRA